MEVMTKDMEANLKRLPDGTILVSIRIIVTLGGDMYV